MIKKIKIVAFSCLILVMYFILTPKSTVQEKNNQEVSPFSAIEWEKEKDIPLVKVEENWYRLNAINKVPIGDVMKYCREQYANKAKRRFEEDLVRVMNGMNRPLGTSVKLKVFDKITKETKTLTNVLATTLNRSAIKSKRKIIEKDARTPFDKIEFKSDYPYIQYEGKWVKLLALAEYPIEKYIQMSKNEPSEINWTYVFVSRMNYMMNDLGIKRGRNIKVSFEKNGYKITKNFLLTDKNREHAIKYYMATRFFDKMRNKMAPPFSGFTLNGKAINIADLKGKIIYVDVWATWCAPCRKQIPYLKKIEKEYHGKEIVFVSLSVDKNKEKWKQFVIDSNLSGTQLIIDQKDLPEFEKNYHYSLPSFILIGAEGKIVNADAPYPSDGKLKLLLDNELKK